MAGRDGHPFAGGLQGITPLRWSTLALMAAALISGSALATTTINHQFTPATINPGDVSVYKVTIANSSLVPLTAAAVTEVFPPQITIASPAGITNTCGFTVNAAAPGSSTVTLTGGTIPAGTGTVDGQCLFQLNVTAAAQGNWLATIPANTTPNATTSGYTAIESGVSVFNTTPANATLAVNTMSPPTGSKAFSATRLAGTPMTLTVTLTNPNAAATIPLTSFVDTFPAGMQIASPPSPTINCTGTGASNGVVTATAGSGSATLTGGVIGQGGTCTMTVSVVVPTIATSPQAFNNALASGAIGNTRGLTSPAFNTSVNVTTPISVTKTFGTPLIPAGQPSLMTIVIANASAANPLAITAFADNLTGTTMKILSTASSPVAAPANPAVACSGVGAAIGTLSAPADLLDQTISLTGATAGRSGNCTITAYLTSTVDGAHVNTIAANAVANPGNFPSPTASATLTANAQLTVSKTVTIPPGPATANVAPGQWAKFVIAINNFSGGAVSGVTFKDVLPSSAGNQMTLFDAGSGLFTAPGPGCTGGTFTGTDATGTSTGLPPTALDAGLLWTGGTLVAGVGAAPGVCTISIWAQVPAAAATGLTFTNNIPVGSITGTGPAGGIANTNASSANVVTISAAAVSKTFAPASIAQGGLSTLTLTIRNRTVSALTGVNLTDNLPAGVTLAANPAATNSCSPPGSLQAFPNGAQVALTGGTVAARPVGSQESTCAITVRVTGVSTGVFGNAINPADFSNAQGAPLPAVVSANLTITTGLTAVKTFTPTSVAPGGVSRVKLTLTNSSNASLTNVSVNDSTFSAGLAVSNPANAATNCAGGPTMVVNPGATNDQLLGATLAAAGSCDFSFDVVATGAGPWSNTVPVGNITSAEGVSNTAAVTANLTKTAAQININKSFNPVLVTGGTPSILQIDVTNPSGVAINGVGLTDSFPPGIVVYSVPAASTDCTGGTVAAVAGDNKVVLSGASVAIGQTCHVFVTTTSTKFLNLTNTIPANSVVSAQGYTNPLGTSATLSTLQGLGVAKAFLPAYVAVGQVSTLTMSLISTFDPNAPTPLTLTGVSYTDTLPNFGGVTPGAGLLIAPTPNASTTCPGTGPGGLAIVSTSNGASNGSVTVSQATIAPGTTCTVSVDTVASALGAYNNTIPVNSVTTDQGVPNATGAAATLFVVTNPTVSKSFANATRNPGQSTVLTVTITNGNAIPLTGVSLTDTLPAGLEIASTPATGGTCTAAGGLVTANAGGATLSMNGATIAANSSCTFFASVLGNTPGTYVDNIPAGSVVTNEGLSNPGATTATLTINAPPTVAKAFSPASIASGGTSTLTITLGNTNAASTTLSAAFTDALPGNVFVAAVPNVVKTCTGAVTAAAGSSSVTYANGSTIPSGGCTISVNVTSSAPGSYTNVVAAGQLSTAVGVNQQPATASLGVDAPAPPTIAKSFSPGTIPASGTSTLTIAFGNPNAGALTLGAAFTDTLPANVVVASTPNVGGSCTGGVTAAAGSSSVTYATGSTIPAGGCTITVAVTSSVPGSYTNTIPTSALTTDGGSPPQPATAGLVVQPATPPTVAKSFNPGTINPGATSVLTINLGNPNSSAISLTSPFTDTLPANVAVASTPGASTNCTGGTLTATALATFVTLSGGSIQPGGCSIVVNVSSSVPGGPYANTILAGSLQTSAGNNGATVTANLFVNPAQPPSVSKSFTPSFIGPGGISKLSVSLSNPNASAATLTSDFVDTLPGPGLVVATPPNLLVGAGCTPANVVATAGGTTVTYQNGGGLAGSGGCSFQVDVTSSTVTTYTNTIPASALRTSVGNNAVAATATLQVLALPTIAKSFTPASIPLGANSTLTLTFGNTNAVALTLSADFVDTLPANLVLGTPATVGGTCASANVVAAAGGPTVTYKSGASIPAAGCTITVPVTTVLAGGYDNNIGPGALVTTIGSNPSGATAHLDVLAADLSITKTDGVPTVIPGTTTTYTIVVSNAGPSPVAGAAVVDVLPGAVGSATWTCAATPGSSCGAANGSGNISSTASLLVGGSATYALVATVSPSATGTLSNTATVAAPVGVTETNPGNNTATDTDTLTPQADLSVVKTGPAAPVPGQNFVYALTVTDLGPSTATTVSLSDTLPAGTTFISLVSPGGWSCSVPSVGAGGTVSCTIPSLLPSAPAVFTLTVKLDAAVLTGTTVSNTATVTTATPDPVSANNVSTTTGTASPSADLSIVKTGPATAVPGGANVVFTTVVTNAGPSDAQSVSVADPTPAGLTFVSNAGSCATAFPCSLGTVPAGATGTITSTYSIPSGYPAPAPLVNTATVSSPTPDPTPADNSSTATVLVPNGVADVAVTKTVDVPAPVVGSNVAFTISVSDLGPSDATGLAVTDVLPSGLTFVSATPSQGSYTPATGLWAVGGVVNGGAATLAIVATVPQAGTIVNTATKTAGNQTDPNPSNNSATAVVNGPAAVADIQVQKTVDNATPTAGSNVTFTVTARNAGPSNATGVAVTDALPVGLTFVSAAPTPGTSYNSSTGVWTIGNLANGASAALAVVANVTANGTYVNTVTKTAENEFDPSTSNDQAVAGVVAGGGGATFADLGIVKTDSPDPVRAGQNLTYTLVVTNRGPNNATNVTATDPLPPGVSLVTAMPSQGGCSGTTTVTCLLGGLPAGNSATISIVVSVSAAAVPSITNTAGVTATETDPNPGDNSATASTTVIPVADVAIAKSVSNPAPLVSQGFTFTVTATNNGPSTANGVVVTDVLPANLSLSLATPSQGTYDSGTHLWTVGALANGASATLGFTVTALVPGPFTNTATKTGQAELDPNPANDSASASGGVAVVADLTIAKTHAPASFVRGSTGTFTLTVSNVGTGPTNAPVTVTDALPAGAAPTAASGSGWVCTVTAPNVSCSRSDVLGVGASWPAITVTVNVLQSAAASISNSASVSGGGDITPGNDTATDVVPVVSSADLAIAKTGPANAIPGTNVAYILVVTNNGPSDAAAVVVTDPAPANLTFVSNSGACTTAFPCSLGAVPAGGTRTITATFAIPANYTAPSPIVNTATVSSATPDPNPANDSSSAPTSVAADLAVVKTIPGAAGGGLATYTIVVTNNGPSVATNVVLTDPLPAPLAFQGLTTTQGTCAPSSTVSCALGTLAAGATATVTITVLVPEPPLPRIRNTASVTADQYDPDLTNNSSTADIAGVPAVPTLSEWALMLLGIALALAGARALRRGA
jgi:uncharacterized repeat protein (TIGR01451 family)